MSIPDFVHTDLETLGLDVPASILEQLATYLDLLLETNRTMNLTAVRDRDRAWRRLIIDSLTLLPGLDDLPEDSALIDIGSGAGLPGLPVAMARPDLRITSLDATGKKIRFQQQVIETLGLSNATAIQDRAETIGHDPEHRDRYDVAVNRAIGPMAELLEYSLPLVKIGGSILAMKGPKVESELAVAGDALAVLGAGELRVFDAYPESFENDLVIVIVAKESRTPDGYPRAPGTPKHDPL